MPSDAEIRQAAELLRRGELVAFPTETVYGLGASALDPVALGRIYAIKRRPLTSPLIVHVDSIDRARSLAASWPDAAQQLAERFWPGPLTLVVSKASDVPDIATAGLPTVGLRIPSHPVALALLRAAAIPVAAPSANRFTGLSPTRAEHVRRELGHQVAMVLDGGPCEVGIESTVVSVAGGLPVLLRPGMILPAEIEAVIGPLHRRPSDSPRHASPGLHPRHYSPRTRLLLAGARELPAGQGIFLYLTQPHPIVYSQRLPNDPARFAAVLYDTLHRLDKQDWDWIAIEPPPDSSAWAPILDRLHRAATK